MGPHDILKEALETFIEKQKQYGDSYIRAMQVLDALFPGKIILETPGDKLRYHLVHFLVSKLCRFAVSDMTHRDSVRDIIVYAAILESVLGEYDE